MKYSAKFFRENLPIWKKKRDPIMVRFLYRPISFFTASFCANRRIGANCVSNFSTIIAVVTCILIGIPSFISGIIGSILMNFWIILDCTDGNLARQIKKEPYGEFLDAMSSYVLVDFFFLSIGFRSAMLGRLFSEKELILLLLGALTSVIENLMSLLYQKYLNVSLDFGRNEKIAYDGTNSNSIMKLRTFLDMNMSVGGFLPIVTLLCCIFNVCELIVIIWFLYYFLEFFATIAYLLLKVKKAQKEIEEKNEGINT